MNAVRHMTITGVRDVRGPGFPCPVWLIDMQDSDGVSYAAGFPHSTLAWRAVEYGIDPEDFDTLLDVILHEPHMKHTTADPTFLYNTDQETARSAHLQRVHEVKQGVVHLDPAGHLGQIRGAYDPRDPIVNEFRRWVDTNRQTTAKERRNG